MPWLSHIKILLVDDESRGRSTLKILLEEYGARVSAVASAMEGLHQFKVDPPHLIISDISMPDVDGYEFLWRLRELEKGHTVVTPVIALTGFTGMQNRIQILRAGFSEHVSKPYDPAELLSIIATLAQGMAQAKPQGVDKGGNRQQAR